MTFVALAPIIAVLAFVAHMLKSLLWPGTRSGWPFPAALGAAFLVFSVVVVWQEGPFGFWAVHTSSLWGNQVWFDLLLALGIGWTLILPRARAAGMAPAPWALLILATGCIGLLAMLARLLWLERRLA